jgi:hypothetical protein
LIFKGSSQTNVFNQGLFNSSIGLNDRPQTFAVKNSIPQTEKEPRRNISQVRDAYENNFGNGAAVGSSSAIFDSLKSRTRKTNLIQTHINQ